MSPFTQVQTAAPVAPAPPGRPVDDPAVVRSAIFDRALGAVRALPPVTSATHTLRIANPAYDGPDNVGTADYKRALLTGDTLARRLRGDVELVDNASGNVIQSKRLTLAAVPYYTDAGVFVNRGTKYAMANQQRLRSGAYTRIRDNGEVETHINVAPGQGVPFRVFLEPSTGIFKAKIDQAQIPLVPLLQSLGVDDAKLRTAWGNQLAAANVAKTRGGDLQKLYTRLVRRGTATTPAQQQAEIRQLLENTRLDPDVMTHTLKAPYDRVNADLLLATTRKLLAVHNRKNPEMLQRLGLEPDDQDDRDHLAFMRLLGPEDIIAERLGTAQRVLRPLLWRAGRTRTLDHVAPGLFSRIVQDAIVGSGLGQATEDINPLQVFEQQLRTTRMGIGGIPSDDSVPESSRSVQPSHAGYIDPIVTPECFDDQTEVMTRRGWVPWPEITDLDEFAVQLDGRLDWRRATALHAGHYAGQMVVADTDILNFCVTPNHRLWTRPDQAGDSRYRFEEARYSYHRSRKFACAGHKPSAGQSRTSYHVPGVPRGANNQVALPPIAIDDWAEFLGWFLSEGSVNICLKPGKQNYFVNLSQSRVAHPQLHADLRALCARLPFRLSCGPRAVVVGGKQITLYLRQFGRSHEKFIPEEAFDWPESARRRLLVGLLKGDGRKGKFDVERLAGLQFCTTSARLADGVARLAFSLGFSSRTVIEPENRAERYHDIHVVHIHSRWERSLQQRHLWRLEPYVGTVYCATVPGGLLYVRRNGKVGHWSGNSGRAGVDVRLSRLVRKGSDGELYSKFIDMRTGQAAWRQPKELFDSVIAFSQARAATPERPHTAASYARFRNALDRGEIVQSRSGQYFVQGLKRGQLDYYPLKDVDYAIPHMEDTFSPTANLVPGKSGMKGQRVAMGARMLTQALPLVDAEAPLVQSGVPDSDQSFEELYSPRLGAIRAKSGGRVLAHTDAGLLVQYDDGTRDTIELAQYVPGSRKTFMHQEPTVSPGARFEAGQLVARSNFTDGAGVTALGRNLRTAWLPLKGLNYEDAVVVSESGAKKLTSQHMYKTSVDIDKKSDQVGLAAYRGIFPKRFTQPQLDKVDDDGVVKVGTRVESGDPLVLVANERQGRVGELSRAGAARWRDAAEVWEHDHPGIVTDVAKTKSGVVVAVKSIAPMQVGDKLCYDELTEVLTRRGWVRVADLLLTDKICTLQDGDAVVYCEPTALHRYQTGGRMYRIETQQVDLFVTAEHRMYVRPRSRTEFGLYSADQIAGKRVEYLKSGRWLGVEPPTVTLPGVTVRHGGRGDAARRLPDLVLPTETYLLLLGAFLSEGNLVDNPRSGSYGIDIAQSKEPNRSQLYAALDAAGIRYSRHGGGEKIRIYSKVLLQHFRTCGNGAGGKRIPDVVFDFSARLCGVLFKWLMWGDGHATQAGRPVDYTTTSPGLADDVQRLCLHAGWAANVKQTQPAGVRILGGQPYQCAATYRVRIVTKKLTPTVNHSHVHRQGGQVEYFVDNYAGPVFCVTVPNHVLYVRRNGKPCWSGNSNRFGSKGVVAAIIPDDQMPRDESGQPIELALNDLGITTRTNPVQVIEAVLGKIAAKRGQPYKLHDFDSISDLRAFAKREADKYGVKGAEDLEDPETGRKIPRVMTGQHFVMKLHHTSESKVSGRAFGSYTADAIPAKGGSEGAKTWGMLHLNAILSHGAVSVAKDGHMVRGQRNPQYWAAVMSGKAPPDPPVPPVYHKFIAQLQASGIHPVRQGTRTHLMAMTDKTINEMAEDRELSSPDTVDWTDDGLKPIPGGLFDERLFGGVSGERWAKITLPEPLPNPVMEEPIRRVLGLTGPQFERIIAGREQFAGGTGPAAIASALDKIDIDRELERAGREIEGTRKTARDAAIRRVGFLLGARKTGVHPRDWMWHSVPVLPPRWRPVSRMQGTDAPMVADANYLYRDLFENKRNLEQLRGQLADVGDERLALYQSVRAVTGLGDPAPEHLREQQIKGSLRHIIGCYDDKTEILTQAGWVRFSDLPEDVPVATLNPSTAAFEWQLPTAYQRYRYCGELVRIQVGSRPRPKQQDVRVGTRIDLLLTPNHRNWVRRRLREYPDSELSRGWGFEEAWQTAAFTGRSWWRTAAASWQGVDVLPDFLNCRFEAFAELVGWWIAEGWIHSDRKIVNLSQETARNRAKCERIAALLKEVGLRHTRHDYVRQPDAYHTKSTAFAVWSIMSEDLVAWLVEHGGELAGNKRLSPAIKNWSTAGLEALLRGYLGGDGCARTIAAVTGIQRRTHKNRSRLTDVYHRVGTTSPQLFDDLQEVACKLGLTLRYSRDGNGVGNQAILTVGSLGGQQLTQTEGTAGKSFEHYDGFVYCCTVPNGIVLVRRNGIPVFSGNSSPKFGVVQRRLLGSQTDLVGRGTIVPNPDLDMDQVGIPEDQAWQVYRPFIVRHLAKRGVAPGRAAEMVLARNDVAKQALSTVMAERPVLLDRAPVLHRFGVMAFWPRIAKGNQIELTPIVTKGFGADFDGDAMQFHVPGSDDAVEDAVTKMLPSANLRAPANFKVHQLPQQEYLAGLYRATRDRKNETPQRFAKLRDMLAALSRGDISHDQPVVIDE